MADERERLRTTFNEDARLYDLARPGYPAAMFDDIVALSGIPQGGHILEIGPGTGQATLPFAQRGYYVLGIDLGADMVAVARSKLTPYPRVRFEIGSFEHARVPPHSFDLAISGTAFHWIDPALGYTRLAEVLRPGGAVALFWNKHVRVPGDEYGFFDEAQALYEQAWPDEPKGVKLLYAGDLDDPEGRAIEESGLFGPLTVRRYEWTQQYSADTYRNVINTYSNHRALEQPRRQALYDGIQNLITHSYGGQIVKGYLTVLYLAHVR